MICSFFMFYFLIPAPQQTHGNSRDKSGKIPRVQFTVRGVHQKIRGVEAWIRGVQDEIVRPRGLLGSWADLHPALLKVCDEAKGGVCVSYLQRSCAQSSAELLWTHLLLPLPPRTAVRANYPQDALKITHSETLKSYFYFFWSTNYFYPIIVIIIVSIFKEHCCHS